MSGAGSPRYMAPECLSGDAYNMKVDVYSFAIVLWEMLSGSSPYMCVRGKEDLINHVGKTNPYDHLCLMQFCHTTLFNNLPFPLP
ncbi:hypothetical protein ACHAXR_000063 [Thalassiosira sp. AJA248-18]